MGLSYHSKSSILAITLAIIILFSNCKQKLKMESLYYDLSNTNDAIFEAVIRGNEKMVEELLLNNANANAKDTDGTMPLHYAAKGGCTEIAKLLLDGEADVKARDRYGRTPLHWAAAEGKIHVAELLINRLANVDVIDHCGMTPLHLVANNGCVKLAELLINAGADVNAICQYASAPFHYAAEANNLGFFKLIKDIYTLNKVDMIYCLKLILEENYSLFNKLYDKNIIIETLKFIDLNFLKVDLSIENMEGKTALNIAKDRGYVDIVQKLEELDKVLR